MRVPITNHQSLINRGDLADGMYFYKIVSNANQIASGKLLIE
jgi:hypothetical protein